MFTSMHPKDLILLLQGSRCLLRGWIEVEMPPPTMTTRMVTIKGKAAGKKKSRTVSYQTVSTIREPEDNSKNTWDLYIQDPETIDAVIEAMSLSNHP